MSLSEPLTLASSNHLFYLCFMAFFLFFNTMTWTSSVFIPLYSPSAGEKVIKKKQTPKAKKPLLVKRSHLRAAKILERLGKGFWPNSEETALMTGMLPKTAQFLQLLDTMVPAWKVWRRWETFLLRGSPWTGSWLEATFGGGGSSKPCKCFQPFGSGSKAWGKAQTWGNSSLPCPCHLPRHLQGMCQPDLQPLLSPELCLRPKLAQGHWEQPGIPPVGYFWLKCQALLVQSVK